VPTTMSSTFWTIASQTRTIMSIFILVRGRTLSVLRFERSLRAVSDSDGTATAPVKIQGDQSFLQIFGPPHLHRTCY
jgi:hypothetical protein